MDTEESLPADSSGDISNIRCHNKILIDNDAESMMLFIETGGFQVSGSSSKSSCGILFMEPAHRLLNGLGEIGFCLPVKSRLEKRQHEK
jgi:hypothetical protein